MELAQNVLTAKHQQAHLHVTLAHLAVLYANMIQYYLLTRVSPVLLNMDFSTLPVINV